MSLTQESIERAEQTQGNIDAEVGRQEYEASKQAKPILLDPSTMSLKEVKAELTVLKEKGKNRSITEDERFTILQDRKAELTPQRASKTATAATSPSLPTGPLYLILGSGGKYKEVQESELPQAGADALKDPSIRVVKGVLMVPQIGFSVIGEAEG